MGWRGTTSAANVGRTGVMLAMLSGAALALTGCMTPQERVEQKADDLAAAGFLVRPANTPERQAMLRRLPPHRFVMSSRGGTVTYVWADPTVCRCLYVGDQTAYDQYRYAARQQRLANERLLTAQLYSDASWDWGAWGPWGPGWGPGLGIGFGW